MSINSRLAIRFIFCAVITLVIMAITMLTLMLLLHRADIGIHSVGNAEAKSSCMVACPACGDTVILLHKGK